MTSYFNACVVTVAISNHKFFLHFFTWTCASHFEKGSATHVVNLWNAYHQQYVRHFEW